MVRISLTFVICLLFNTITNAQKRTDMETTDQYKKEAKQAVLDFFEGFHAGDTAKIKSVLVPESTLKTIKESEEGKRSVVNTPMNKFLEAIHKRPNTQRWNEQLLLFKIEAAKDIAQIWTPYEFYFNEKLSHCGVNIFQLFNDGTEWKILSIVDTRHKEGCQ